MYHKHLTSVENCGDSAVIMMERPLVVSATDRKTHHERTHHEASRYRGWKLFLSLFLSLCSEFLQGKAVSNYRTMSPAIHLQKTFYRLRCCYVPTVPTVRTGDATQGLLYRDWCKYMHIISISLCHFRLIYIDIYIDIEYLYFHVRRRRQST